MSESNQTTMTNKQLIKLAVKAGFEKYEDCSCSGKSDLDMTVQVGEYPCGEAVVAFGKLVWNAALDSAAKKFDRCFNPLVSDHIKEGKL